MAGPSDARTKTNRRTNAGSILVFWIGLILCLAVQGALTIQPLMNRALPPEFDDAVGYLVKTAQMEECFHQDCPALEDLRPQLLSPSKSAEAAAEKDLAASRIFPVYHFSYSALLLGLKGLGLSLMEAHNAVWICAPLFFCLAFACFLWSLWGRTVAGLALILLATKVFPGTGLHLVQPSNLAMGLAVFMWARLIARRGQAPITLLAGTLVLIATHPVGRIYAAMAVLFALALADRPKSPRMIVPAISALALVALTFIISPLVDRPHLFNEPVFPGGDGFLFAFFGGVARSVVEIFSTLVRHEAGLTGAAPIFCAAVVLGYLTLDRSDRERVLRVFLIYAFFLVVLVFYGPTQPADAFLRLWIPMMVLLSGAVARSILQALAWSRDAAGALRAGPDRVGIQTIWPLVLAAFLLGYAGHMMIRGAEQVQATIEHRQRRQPLALDPAQPSALLARAAKGDRVVYNSMILMPFYFIHGAMRLGAVYYHPALAGEAATGPWMTEPRPRFLVAYHPLVYHPSFEGVREHNWWESPPDFYQSPLSARRRHNPLLREGVLTAASLRWIQFVPQTGPLAGVPRVFIQNPGKSSYLFVVPIGPLGNPEWRRKYRVVVPAGQSGWMDLDGMTPGDTGFRLVMPDARAGFKIGGMRFTPGPLHWPWSVKAAVVVETRDGETGEVRRSFDPIELAPPGLHGRPLRVLDDRGSSVLVEIGD